MSGVVPSAATIGESELPKRRSEKKMAPEEQNTKEG